MSCDNYIDLSLTDNICTTCLKIIFISGEPFGAQEICYTQNYHNELNFMEILNMFLVSQRNLSNNKTCKEFAMPKKSGMPCLFFGWLY